MLILIYYLKWRIITSVYKYISYIHQNTDVKVDLITTHLQWKWVCWRTSPQTIELLTTIWLTCLQKSHFNFQESQKHNISHSYALYSQSLYESFWIIGWRQWIENFAIASHSNDSTFPRMYWQIVCKFRICYNCRLTINSYTALDFSISIIYQKENRITIINNRTIS